MPRACVIVLDAVGVGELPDAADYGDEGSDTLGNVARAVGGARASSGVQARSSGALAKSRCTTPAGTSP